MTIPTVAVTVKLANLTGIADVVGKTVTATLDKADRYGGFLVPSSVSGVVDASGDVVLQCFPNNPTTGLGTTGSTYTFACKALSFRETAQVPNSACNLHDIADLATAVSDSALDLHIADTAGAHAASAISVAAIAGITGTAGQTVLAELAANKEATANKDASGGYAGLTLFKLNLKNALGTITSFFTTAATVARTWTLPDKDGTVAMTSDITGTNSGNNTGDETGPRIATLTHAASLKTALVDADEVTGGDSAAAFGLIRTTWTGVKAFLKTYFDTLYLAALPLFIPMGGTTNAFPALKRNGAGLDVRLADDSGYANLSAGSASFAGMLSASGITTTANTSQGVTLGRYSAGQPYSYLWLGSTSSELQMRAGDNTEILAVGKGYVEIGRGNAASSLNIYNTRTDGSNWERGYAGWVANLFRIGVEKAGTGTYRSLDLYSAGGHIYFSPGGSTVWRFDGTTGSLLVQGDNAYDIGATSSGRPRSGYFGTSVVTAGLTTGTVTKTANYTSTVSDNTILVDATAGNVTITMEAVSGIGGRRKTIKKIDASANTVTIDGNASETIDGATTVVLSAQWASRSIQVNAGGTAWNVLASI